MWQDFIPIYTYIIMYINKILLFHFQFDLRMAQYYLMLCTAGLRYAKSVATVHRQSLKVLYKKQYHDYYRDILHK